MEQTTNVEAGSKRKVLIVGVAAGVVVVVIAAIWWLAGGGKGGNLAGEGEKKEVPMYNGQVLSDIYDSSVPQGAVVDDAAARSVVAASDNLGLDTKARTFEIRATADGFEPDTFTVNQWDRAEFSFTAVDGDYDFSVPYLGVYYFPIKEGTTKSVVFEANTAGTFTFECRDACPSGGKISGKFIVVPRSVEEVRK